MKFCPKCGNKLPDDAKFCNSCGQPQPELEPKKEEVVEEPVVKEETKAVDTSMSPRQRFNDLMKNDESFNSIVKTSKKLNLVSLGNLLFIIPWLVCLFVPVAQFTGVNVSEAGMYEMNALGKQFPVSFSAFTVNTYKTLAGNHSLIPNVTLGIMGMMAFIFGFLFIALLVLVGLLGTPKSYILKTYEAGKKDELLKTIKSPTKFLYGSFLGVAPFMSAVSTYVSCTDITYKEGSRYYFGEVASLKSGLITSIVVFALCVAIMVVTMFVLRSLVLKKLKA